MGIEVQVVEGTKAGAGRRRRHDRGLRTNGPHRMSPTSNNSHPVTLYGIVNCDTVKRARTWLAAQAVDVPFHDFKKQGVPAAALDAWLQAVPWTMLINRQGTTWRKLPLAEQTALLDTVSARALALAQPSVIKRPVVQWSDGSVTVGLQALMDQHALPT